MRPQHLILAACWVLLSGAAPAAWPQKGKALKPSTSLTEEELRAEPEPAPVSAAKAGPIRIRLLSERGYEDAKGRFIVDLLEREYAYLGAQFETADGRPVFGVKPVITSAKGSRIAPIAESTSSEESDRSGLFEFGVIAGKMGEDVISIAYGAARAELRLNVISLKAAGYQQIDEVAGALRWEDLMQAKLKYSGEVLRAEFPANIAAANGKTVKIAGFMMPLEPQEKQQHFLISSSPPSCFFHVPGGPAGAVEVFASKGIAASWDPLLLEGTFETVQKNQMGVIYRLKNAKIVRK